MGERDRIGKSIGRDIPSLTDTLLRVVGSYGGVSPLGDQPLSLLCAYLSSLNEICEQALHAIDQLSVSASVPPARPSDVHAKYHLYGFLSRVKTATDLVALILNEVFELSIPEKRCSLERGTVCQALRRCAHGCERGAVVASQLAATLDKARNQWIGPFYDFRNLVIHRNALALVRAPHPQTGQFHAFVAPAGILAAACDRQVLEQFFTQMGLVEKPLASSTLIGPVYLCEQLWTRLAMLVNSVLAQSRPQIDDFVFEKGAPPDEMPYAPRDSRRTAVEQEFEGPCATSSVTWEGSMSKILPTWAARSKFEYSGSVAAGTEILYGKKPYRQRISAAQYRRLLTHFKGATVGIGTSRTDPTPGSVGEWLQANVTKTAIASYVGPILLQERYAERVPGARSKIRFK